MLRITADPSGTRGEFADSGSGTSRRRNGDATKLQARKGPAIVTNLVVPKTGGMNTTKVNLVRWLKNEGDAVKQGEGVVELETEKISYELDAPVDGVLLKIVIAEPTEVEVGGLLAYLGAPGDKVPAA
ncbi:MAG TPA: lipoyl domain-containing protein [Candidatus Dormibacteraeota bacterium]|nr:lipoyl domain-containing protein [Candidatus Dormibacteraeota bacterium]